MSARLPEGLGRWPSLDGAPCAEDERYGLHEATAWRRDFFMGYAAQVRGADFTSCGHLGQGSVATFWHPMPGLLLCGACLVPLLVASYSRPSRCARCGRLPDPGRGDLVNEVEMLRSCSFVVVRWTSCRSCHDLEWEVRAARTSEPPTALRAVEEPSQAAHVSAEQESIRRVAGERMGSAWVVTTVLTSGKDRRKTYLTSEGAARAVARACEAGLEATVERCVLLRPPPGRRRG